MSSFKGLIADVNGMLIFDAVCPNYVFQWANHHCHPQEQVQYWLYLHLYHSKSHYAVCRLAKTNDNVLGRLDIWLSQTSRNHMGPIIGT